MADFLRDTHTFLLPGPSGDLELLTTWPAQEPACVAIICHPHPLYQGSMHNKVVTTLAKTFDELSLATVRFNYRGVGRSTGQYGHIDGEIEDLWAIKCWVAQQLPQKKYYLAGFSFGAFIAAAVANQSDDVQQLISVAPAVHHADFGRLLSIPCPWLVIQGDQDDIVDYQQVVQFARKPPSPLTLVTLADTGHFFHGKLLQLKQIITQNIINTS